MAIRSQSVAIIAECILGDPGAVSRVGRKGAKKHFKHGRKSPLVPTLTGPFPRGQANAGSWLGTKNVLHYCAQSANSFSWVLFVSSYTTAIDSITACLAHAPKKCTQSGNFQFDINSPVQNTVYPKTKDAFPKIQAWAYNKCSLLHRSRLLKYSGVFPFFSLYHDYSNLLTLSNASDPLWRWISINHIQVICHCLFTLTSFTKREIRYSHVAVEQWRQRNVQKSVMHVQSCCFALSNHCFFLLSRRRFILSWVWSSGWTWPTFRQPVP